MVFCLTKQNPLCDSFGGQEERRKRNETFFNLLDRDIIDSEFKQTRFVNEISEQENFLDVKGNPYFNLLKYLISRGYIDESYFDYITYFYYMLYKM